MGDKNSGRNFPRAPQDAGDRDGEGGYNTAGYFQHNRKPGSSRDSRSHTGDDERYDAFHSGKEEDFRAGGYYGSNYGNIGERNRGRDIERNAGYREQYNRLTRDEWPAVREAADRRGIDLRWHELRGRGAHKGKGPKDYRRSDFRIHEDIYDVLYEDPYIDASDIEISVEKGEVILSGTVENRHIKRRVEDIIEQQVSGINHLENRLRPVRRGGGAVNISNE